MQCWLYAATVFALCTKGTVGFVDEAFAAGAALALNWSRSGLADLNLLSNLVTAEPDADIARFYLFTRRNPKVAQQLYSQRRLSITSSYFNRNAETKIIVHGYLSSANSSWIPILTKELLRHDGYNIIVVDWSGFEGSETLYNLAVSRTDAVGNAAAKLIKALRTVVGVDASTFHVIGHSLGAHAAGYAGRRTPGLGRITGLDPAGPEFENRDPHDRLDPTDATFVDAIHTDAISFFDMLRGNGGFGITKQVGHADFYPNGGMSQPACSRNLLANTTLWNYVACDHEISTEYFTFSINNCRFRGFPCSSYWSFSSGQCRRTAMSSPANLNVMGFHAQKPRSASAKYYLSTTVSKPYCTACNATAAFSAGRVIDDACV